MHYTEATGKIQVNAQDSIRHQLFACYKKNCGYNLSCESYVLIATLLYFDLSVAAGLWQCSNSDGQCLGLGGLGVGRVPVLHIHTQVK